MTEASHLFDVGRHLSQSKKQDVSFGLLQHERKSVLYLSSYTKFTISAQLDEMRNWECVSFSGMPLL